jgi:hemin uptake protein HemP
LPFPNRKETILPTNFEKKFKTSVQKNGTDFMFVYTDNNCKIQYELSPKDGLINSLTLKQGKQNIPINQNGAVYF